MVTLLQSGWENGGTDPVLDGNVWDGKWGSNISVVATDPHHGSNALQARYSAQYVRKGFTAPEYSTLYMRAYVKLDIMPNRNDTPNPLTDWGTVMLFRMGYYDATYVMNNIMAVEIVHDGTNVMWAYASSEGLKWSSQKMNPSPNQYYCVEIRATASTTGGATYQMWVDGEELTDITLTSVYSNFPTMNRVEAGLVWTNCTLTYPTVTMDCVVIADTGPIGVEGAAQTFTLLYQGSQTTGGAPLAGIPLTYDDGSGPQTLQSGQSDNLPAGTIITISVQDEAVV